MAKVRVKRAAPGATLPAQPEEIKPAESASESKESRTLRATAPPVNPSKKPPTPVESMLLIPLNARVDEPKTRHEYVKMLNLMETPKDFALVPEFLRELRLADRPVTARMLAKTVRRGSELNCEALVIDMFQRIETIGVSIRHAYIMSEVAVAMVHCALKGRFAQADLDKALRLYDKAFTILEDPRQLVKWSQPEYLERDVWRRPFVWGSAMTLEAIREIRYGRREYAPGDERGLVPRATKFAELFTNEVFAMQRDQKANHHNARLVQWIPTYFGLKFALQIINQDSALGRRLQEVLTVIEPEIHRSMQIVKESPSGETFDRGIKLYAALEKALEVEPQAYADKTMAEDGAAAVKDVFTPV